MFLMPWKRAHSAEILSHLKVNFPFPASEASKLNVKFTAEESNKFIQWKYPMKFH